jgi:hypothetical protein
MPHSIYMDLKKHVKSRLFSRKTKLLMYKTRVRSILTYASETWLLSKADESSLGLFGRRFLRWVFGPVQDKGTWKEDVKPRIVQAI